ncbi:MAG: hypothetical protein IJA83_10290 [Clostridia bacterium]|nr:hypothetical protein [Clostridia bacterium]
MLKRSMPNLKEVFCLIRMEPACFDAQTLDALADCCIPGESSDHAMRQVLARAAEGPTVFPYPPRWRHPGSDDPMDAAPCGTQAQCALLRSILRTAAQLRREEKLPVLIQLAEAAHNLPEAIFLRDEPWICRVLEELQEFCEDYSVTLLPPDGTL